MAFSAKYFLSRVASEIKKEVWRPNSLPPNFKASNRNSYAIPFSRHLKISLYKEIEKNSDKIFNMFCGISLQRLTSKANSTAATGIEASTDFLLLIHC